jgi:hypothetical protein
LTVFNGNVEAIQVKGVSLLQHKEGDSSNNQIHFENYSSSLTFRLNNYPKRMQQWHTSSLAVDHLH